MQPVRLKLESWGFFLCACYAASCIVCVWKCSSSHHIENIFERIPCNIALLQEHKQKSHGASIVKICKRKRSCQYFMQQVISENKRIFSTEELQDLGHDGTLLRNKKMLKYCLKEQNFVPEVQAQKRSRSMLPPCS